MIEIYTLITRALNGSVTIMTQSDSFTSVRLAEKAEEAIKEANKNCTFPIITDIHKSIVYENEEEVPILSENHEQ